MNLIETLDYAKSLGWTLLNLGEKAMGGWTARMYNPVRAREVLGKQGYNDSLTDYGHGDTAEAAILRALRLRYDRLTGKVVEIELPPWSDAAQARLEAALEAALRVHAMTPLDFVPQATVTRLEAAVTAAIVARQRRKAGR